MTRLDAIAFQTVVSDLFDENAYLLYRPERADCIVVDPGLDTEKIAQKIDEIAKKPVAILNTHGHADHIAGNAAIKSRWPSAILVIGEGDAPKLGDPYLNLSAGYGFAIASPPADRTVREGETVEVAGICWKVRETPGHSVGHVVFIAEDSAPALVLGGDVLFSGSIGRTDFFDGDHDALLASIRDKLYVLPDATIVLPGHGPTTTIGEEKRTNPYVRG